MKKTDMSNNTRKHKHWTLVISHRIPWTKRHKYMLKAPRFRCTAQSSIPLIILYHSLATTTPINNIIINIKHRRHLFKSSSSSSPSQTTHQFKCKTSSSYNLSSPPSRLFNILAEHAFQRLETFATFTAIAQVVRMKIYQCAVSAAELWPWKLFWW